MLWLRRRILDQCGDRGLRNLCRDLLRQACHLEKVRVQKVAERIQSGAKGDSELAIERAGVSGNRRPETEELDEEPITSSCQQGWSLANVGWYPPFSETPP